MKTPPPRRMMLPNRDRPFWQRPDDSAEHDLLYLGWGERQFGETPCPVVRHEGWMYSIVEHGSPTLVTETVRHEIPAGTAVLIGPDHATGWTDAGARVCRLLTWTWRAPATPLLSAARPDMLRRVSLSPAVLARLQSLHALCREEVRMADPVMGAALSGLHRLVEATLTRPDVVSSNHEQGVERVSLAVRWMESHLESRQPAVRIADYLGVSSSTLHRLFKQQVGRSPDAHFHEMKMAAAKERLAAGQSVKVVAYELGYRHAGDFSRAYTRHFGRSPGSLRAESACPESQA